MIENYKGYEVLLTRPDAADPLSTTYSYARAIIASAAGVRHVTDKRGAPQVQRSYTLLAHGYEQIAELRSFIERRLGRTVPFFLPSNRADLLLALAAPAGASSITVTDTQYAQTLFAVPARRYFYTGLHYLRVISATANGNGTQTLALESQLQAALPAGAQLQSLNFVRLASDETTISYRTPTFAEVVLDTTDIPREMP